MKSFDEIASEYDLWYQTEKGKNIDEKEKKLLLAFCKFSSGKTVLDVGCGTGNYLSWFRKLGLISFGIDISFEMLKVSKTKENPPLFKADSQNLPFKNEKFDYSVIITTLEFVKNPHETLKEMCRVTKKRLFIGMINQLSFYGFKIWLKSKLKKSIYKNAHFLNIFKIKKLIKKTFKNNHINWKGICFNSKFKPKKSIFAPYLGICIEKEKN